MSDRFSPGSLPAFEAETIADRTVADRAVWVGYTSCLGLGHECLQFRGKEAVLNPEGLDKAIEIGSRAH